VLLQLGLRGLTRSIVALLDITVSARTAHGITPPYPERQPGSQPRARLKQEE